MSIPRTGVRLLGRSAKTLTTNRVQGNRTISLVVRVNKRILLKRTMFQIVILNCEICCILDLGKNKTNKSEMKTKLFNSRNKIF